MYKTDYKVSLALKCTEKGRKKIVAFEKEFSITYNFDLFQKFDITLTYKIYMNWL